MKSSTTNMYRATVLLLFFYLNIAAGFCQQIKVCDFYILPTDKTAEQYPRRDLNENLCALVKIKTNGINKLNFPNTKQYIGAITEKDGTYYVYIPTITSKITFAHDDYMPGSIDLEEFGYKKELKEGKTYEAILEAPKLQDYKSSGINIKVSPNIVGCYVTIDGKKHSLPSSGILQINCSPGAHTYEVIAPNYEKERGNVNVSDSYVPLSVFLHPTTVSIDVRTIPTNAEVYVDDVNYGKSGVLSIPLGLHEIRIAAKDYMDYTMSLNVDQHTNLPLIELQKNKGQIINVHPVAVKIICDSEHLYKNNKLIEEWSNGGTLYFMPGSSCRLSDDYGKGAILNVEDVPMTVKLVENAIFVIERGDKTEKKKR